MATRSKGGREARAGARPAPDDTGLGEPGAAVARLTRDQKLELYYWMRLTRSLEERLVNLYRMMRSTRDLSPAARFLGAEGTPGEYQAVVILLGLLSGHARLLHE